MNYYIKSKSSISGVASISLTEKQASEFKDSFDFLDENSKEVQAYFTEQEAQAKAAKERQAAKAEVAAKLAKATGLSTDELKLLGIG
jgi:uncharacterized coiled-coil DUF342 family protein